MATPSRFFRGVASQYSRLVLPRTTPHYFTPKQISSVSTRVPFLFERDETVRMNATPLMDTTIMERTETVMLSMADGISQAVIDMNASVVDMHMHASVIDVPSSVIDMPSSNVVIDLPESESSTPIENESDVNNAPIIASTKRTYQPHEKRRRRKHGFLSRLVDRHGRNTLNRRKTKKRSRMVSI